MTCCRTSPTWSLHHEGGERMPPGSQPRDPWRSCGGGLTKSKPPFRTRVWCSPASSCLLQGANTSTSWGSRPRQRRPRMGVGVRRSRRPCHSTASAAALHRGVERRRPDKKHTVRAVRAMPSAFSATTHFITGHGTVERNLGSTYILPYTRAASLKN